MKTKKYLGDKVWVDHDTRGLVLTTEGEWGVTNTVVLEVKTLENLFTYLGIDTRLAWPGKPVIHAASRPA